MERCAIKIFNTVIVVIIIIIIIMINEVHFVLQFLLAIILQTTEITTTEGQYNCF